MKRKGFTLIELLAVIVILSIIAVIATPMVLNTIEDAKKGAAQSSAYTYVNEIEKQLAISEMNSDRIEDGTYYVGDIEVSYKGEGPTQGEIVIENMYVKRTKLCVDNYSIDYMDGKTSLSNNDYCSSDFTITLYINQEEQSKNIGMNTKTTFELTDISNMTNMSCNNGAIPTIEENTLKITNIFGDTVCTINDSLEDTIANLDSTETNIVMLSNVELVNTLSIKYENNVVLDLNGKIIEYASEGYAAIVNRGNLVINDSDLSGTIKSSSRVIQNSSNGILYINNGYFYTTSTVSWLVPAIINDGDNSKIIIDGSNATFDDSGNYLTGIFIVACGNTEYNVCTEGSYGIFNFRSGYIQVSGATIYSFYDNVHNYREGKINITNNTYINNFNDLGYRGAIYNSSFGTINICSSTIISLSRDIRNVDSGIVNYSSNVIFTNGTNTPIVGGVTENIISNYTGTCSS